MALQDHQPKGFRQRLLAQERPPEKRLHDERGPHVGLGRAGPFRGSSGIRGPVPPGRRSGSRVLLSDAQLQSKSAIARHVHTRDQRAVVNSKTPWPLSLSISLAIQQPA